MFCVERAEILPLCPEHHRGNTGVHGLGAKGFEKFHKVAFDTLLEKGGGMAKQ